MQIDLSRRFRAFTFRLGAAFALIGLAASILALGEAQAQHPTEVTSIVNSEADTSLEVNHNGSLLMPGTRITDGTENDSIPATGSGVRMMWYPAKAAFRAGAVFNSGAKWDASNIGAFSVALGSDTEASGYSSTATGNSTKASGVNSTAMGKDTRATGRNATAIGKETLAAGESSIAVGSNAESLSHNTFVWADGTTSSFWSTGDDQFLVRASGGVGFGTNSPQTQFDVQRDVSGSAGDPANHVAFVENTGGSNSDGMAIQAGPTADPGSGANYLTFFDGDGDPIGAIEGDGTGSITQTSGSGDFAEELPVAKGAEAPEPAEIVGVRGGKVSLRAKGADRVMIASRAPILKGNATPATEKDDDRRVAVAFIGQVPVKVRGEAQPGDLIVPSGKEDGTARAVSPEEYRQKKHGLVAGQAWEGKASKEVGEVTVAVGLGQSGAVAEQLQKQRSRIADLEAENKQIKQKQKKLEERLAALEAERSESALAGLGGPRTSGLWLVLLALGGGVGIGFFWRRRS